MEPTWGSDDGIGVNGSSGNSGVFGTSFGGKGVKKDQMREPKFFDPAPDQLEVVMVGVATLQRRSRSSAYAKPAIQN